ncbi:MAG TPA: hypothetical protein VIF64_20535 [Pyrinomonadaceae bacterium]|jgi:hypothetical protein
MTVQPAIAGGSIKPGVERSGTPGHVTKQKCEPAKAGDSFRFNVSEFINSLTWNGTVDRSAVCLVLIFPITWGSAALHPRLYALARYRGL